MDLAVFESPKFFLEAINKGHLAWSDCAGYSNRAILIVIEKSIAINYMESVEYEI